MTILVDALSVPSDLALTKVIHMPLEQRFLGVFVLTINQLPLADIGAFTPCCWAGLLFGNNIPKCLLDYRISCWR